MSDPQFIILAVVGLGAFMLGYLWGSVPMMEGGSIVPVHPCADACLDGDDMNDPTADPPDWCAECDEQDPRGIWTLLADHTCAVVA